MEPDAVSTTLAAHLLSSRRDGGPRLHLGCGQVRLDGYVNVDFPPDEHTVQQTSAAEFFADITRIDLPSAIVQEIRCHHVFEHFDRVTALAQLCRWHSWLATSGTLTIETPDLDGCMRRLAAWRTPARERDQVIRHLFGSHEAAWAYHRDGWSEARFRRVLRPLGFRVVAVEHGGAGSLPNVTVRARKNRTLELAELRSVAAVLLESSLVDGSDTERRLYEVWLGRLDRSLGLTR